ncbi:uncharacterized protein LOC126815353 [Patella vulgata]|uniref:uncharacterized protein LOC126815353 n=1 Tax=Patella vulgata TaxID=6465 RepID=UPI0021809144|nr:uncharacterized protein LOC126815353 [Patella vulgata]
MAATTTADMKSRHRQLGRPPKCDTDKRQRQQEAYKKRDASRVYLASSYDRWKRLGGKLGLKDSSLAWHLMEAHATNCDECGLTEDNEDEDSMETKNPSLFFPALVRCIHKLCHRHYSFGDCVQVMGLICLEVDNGKKENFSIKEMVHKPFMLQLAKNNNNSTKTVHNFDNIQSNDIAINNNIEFMKNCDEILNKDDLSDDCGGEMEEDSDPNAEKDSESDLSDTEQLSSNSDINNYTNNILHDIQNKTTEDKTLSQRLIIIEKSEETTDNLNKSSQSEDKDSSFISVGNEEYDVDNNNKTDCLEQSSSSLLVVPAIPFSSPKPVSLKTTMESMETKCSNNQQLVCDNLKSTQSCLEFLPEPSNIYQSKDTSSYRDDSRACTNTQNTEAFRGSIDLPDETELSPSSISPREVQVLKETSETVVLENFSTYQNRRIEENQNMVTDESHKEETSTEREPSSTSHATGGLKYNTDTVALKANSIGLDLSIVKTEQPDSWDTQKHENVSKTHNRKRKSSEMDPLDRENNHNFSPSYLNGNTRREIVYKVEYEHLEKNPFCDFYELTSHYPNIQQRTFYRWKRKIKDEFIFLEQNPDMSYDDFCKCIPHAKQEVFDTWKNLIGGGHRFSTMHVSSLDTSPNHPAAKKLDLSSISNNPSLSLLQMYPHMSYQEFSYTHPTVPLELFSSYKQQVLSAISFVEKNHNMEFKDLTKHFSFVSEEAFLAWRKYAQMLNAQRMEKTVKEEKTDQQSNLMTMQNAMMQQYPHLMMGSAGMAAYNALMNQAMATPNSAAPLFPALMQAAVSQAQHPLLSSQWQQQSLAAVQAQTQSMFINQAQQHLLLNQSQHQQSSLSKLQSLTQVLCNNMKDSDKSSSCSSSPDTVSPLPPNESITKKQNKNEYLYFIYHPDVSYPDFNLHFPHISNRTFYRWKKEVKDAQALLNENPHYTYDDISNYFPNVPQDIFKQWKEKKNHTTSSSPAPIKHQVWRPHVADYKQFYNHHSVKEPNGILKAVLENDTSNNVIRIPQYKPLDFLNSKVQKEEGNEYKKKYEYLQMNPRMSYSQYELIYPDISSKTFYRWKKELKDGFKMIKADQEIPYSKFRTFFPDFSENLFKKWKLYLEVDPTCNLISDESPSSQPSDTDEDFKLKIPSSEEEELEDVISDGRTYSHNRQKKQARPEYLCLQENPFIDLQEVINSFPGVSKRTLYRWKKEILQAVEFVRGQPDVSFQDFSVYFPEVVEQNFIRWKSAIKAAATSLKEIENECPQDLSKPNSTESHDSPKHNAENYRCTINIPKPQEAMFYNNEGRKSAESEKSDCSPSEDVKSLKGQRTDFEYILENPEVDFEKFSKLYSSVDQFKFYKWKSEAHRWISLIMSSPNIDFNIFSIYCHSMPEQIFDKWKQVALGNENGPVNLSVLPLNQDTSTPSTETDGSIFNNTNINNDTPSPGSDLNGTYYKSLKTLTPRSRKVNLREYHCFLQNPYMTFQELNEIFNTISGRTFYRWKKEVKEKLEYLETNLDSNFDAFSKLFPEVTEDIYNVWKQKAATAVAAKRTPMQTGHWWTMNHHQNPDDQKTHLTPESSKESLDSQASSRYNYPKENEELENEEMVQLSKSPGIKRAAGSSYEKEEKYPKIESPVDQQYGDLGNTIQQMLHQYSNHSNKFHLHYGMSPSSQLFMGTPPLLSTSTPPYVVNPTSVNNPNDVVRSRNNNPSIFPTNSSVPLTNLNNKSLSSPVTSLSSTVNCDEIYSPKFRKRQREEYCYLQQNPTMDFNEFTSHFPRVSIRTFYRWKKELKEDK